VKPLPALRRRLYLIVGHRTTGRSLSTGRGATAEALARRACLRRCLRPAWRDIRQTCLGAVASRQGVPGQSALERDAANLCGSLYVKSGNSALLIPRGFIGYVLTIVWDLLIVLDGLRVKLETT
jgi:hypothetical protein